MARYPEEMKEAIIQKMTPPNNVPVSQLMKADATVYTWRKQARNKGAPAPGNGLQFELCTAAIHKITGHATAPCHQTVMAGVVGRQHFIDVACQDLFITKTDGTGWPRSDRSHLIHPCPTFGHRQTEVISQLFQRQRDTDILPALIALAVDLQYQWRVLFIH